MGVTANWFLGDIEIAEESDPLGPAQARIEDMGTPIDLEGGTAKLRTKLLTLLEQESRLFNSGTSCQVKDNAQGCCSACPIRHRDELDPMSALCSLGVEQERLVTLMVIADERPDRLP